MSVTCTQFWLLVRFVVASSVTVTLFAAGVHVSPTALSVSGLRLRDVGDGARRRPRGRGFVEHQLGDL